MFKMNTISPTLFGLLMLLLTSTITSSDCSEGCLRCEVNQEGIGSCSTCDVFTGFVMSSEGDCIKHEDANCLVFAFNENDSICSQCIQGYIIDEETKHCVEVPAEKKITNCHSYTLIGRCSLCARDTYMNENECLAVKIKKPNCFKYFDDSLCSVCDEGFKLDSGNCVSTNSENTDCFLEASSKCTQCDYGYISTQNPMNFVSDKQSYVQKMIHELFWGQKHSQYPVSSCIKSPDSNCLIFEEALPENSLVPICKTCKKGYFLNLLTSKCEEYPMSGVLNCSQYSDFLTCSECSPEFYLECNECKSRSTYSNCSIPDKRMDRCHTCADGFFLNESFTCENRSPEVIEHCSVYNRLENICDECEPNYSLTNTSDMCFKQISHCTNYKSPSINSDTKLICEECDTDYYLDEQTGMCNLKFILNCNSYNGDHNLCTACETNFNLINNECVSTTVAIPNCRDPVPNTSDCSVCEDLFYLSDSLQCLPIDDADCLENTQNENSCTKCKANRYLKLIPGTTNKKCSISNTASPVPNCLNSTSSTPNTICSECESNYNLVDEEVFYKQNPEGCLSANELNSRQYCKSLDVDYEYDSLIMSTDAIPSLIVTTTPNSICSQLSSKSASPLNEAYGSCDECRNSEEFFLKNNTCFKRSKMYLNQCEKYNDAKDECEICKTGTYGVSREIETEIKCMPDPDGFTPLSNCLVHDASDHSLCVICDDGYYLDSKRLCVQSENDKKDFDFKLNIRFTSDKLLPMISYQTQSTNEFATRYCEKFMKLEFDDKYSHCIKCLPETYQIKKQTMIDFDENSKPGYFARTAYECFDQVNYSVFSKMENNQSVPYVSSDDCLDATFDARKMIYCQNCKNGLIPTFIKVDYENDPVMGNTLTYAVESCTPTENAKFAEKKYSGLGFMNQFNSSSQSIVNLGLESVSFDSCKNPNQNLVYLFILGEPSEMLERYHRTSMQEKVKLYDCISIDHHNKIEGCQIYYNSPEKWNNMTDGLKCMSCQPGYSASNSDSERPLNDLTCTRIDNCDFSDPSQNTMMNGCNNCSAGYTNPIKVHDSDKMFIDYTTCSAVTIENCLNEFPGDSTCVICKKGYALSDNKSSCILATLPDNCDSIGMLSESIDYDKTTNSYSEFEMHNQYVFLSEYKNDYRTGKCKTCSTGHSHFVDINPILELNDPTFECVSHADTDDTVSNCKLYSGNAEKSCAKCIEGFIITNDGQCISDSNNTFKDCQKVELSNLTNDYVCSECKLGYSPEERDQKRCFKAIHYCLEYSERTSLPSCILCEEGYLLISGKTSTFTMCIENTGINPYFKKWQISIQNSGTFNIFQDYIFDGYNDFNPPNKFQRQSCFPDSFIPFCAEGDANTLECTTCQDGYYKRLSHNQCFPNSIVGCDVQTNMYECDTCLDDYFKSDLSQCVQRFALYCDETAPDADECTSCKDGYYFKDNKCFPYTIQHCDDFVTTDDECVICKDGFYVENAKCYAHTVVGCKTFSPSKNECSSCFDQHYKSNGLCHKHTVKYCDMYNTSYNRCTSCIQNGSETTNQGVYNFAVGDGTCHQSEEIMNCQKYYATGISIGKCEQCKEGYMNIDLTKCEQKPSGIANCQEYSSVNVCSMCEPSYYLDLTNNKCLPVYRPIENCWNHLSLTECDQCASGFIPSVDKTSCVAVIETSCKSWSDPNTCSECPPNKLINPVMSVDQTQVLKTECKEYIPNCKMIKGTPYQLSEEELNELNQENEGQNQEENPEPELPYHCHQCDPDYYTTGKRTTCTKSQTPILNCINYSQDDQCETCEKGYVLSINKKECSRENNRVGDNCRNGMLTEESLCRACLPGKILNDEGLCVECGGTGCLQCDPTDTTKCLICQGGHHMTVSLVCEANTDNKLDLKPEELMEAEKSENDQVNNTAVLN